MQKRIIKIELLPIDLKTECAWCNRYAVERHTIDFGQGTPEKFRYQTLNLCKFHAEENKNPMSVRSAVMNGKEGGEKR